ncbi:c-type cytochrome [Pseudoroseicyclus sp. CXY001]|uniref:c-type cytochrome n=1 Tax=Pseudoroseicyclus sp. CXY001 TaxID=3242492 RepID=UPI003570D171
MKLPFAAALGGLTFLAGAAAAQNAATVDFEADVQRTFDRRCVACHNDRAPGSEMSLQAGSSLDNILGVPSVELAGMNRVEPGNLEQSYLAHKLQGTHVEVGGSGERMPLGGRLRDAELEAIFAWIESLPPEEGAAEDAAEDAGEDAADADDAAEPTDADVSE